LSLLLLPSSFGLRAFNGTLVDENGNLVQLRGVNKMGSEYMCVTNNLVFDGPTDENSLNNIGNWKVNALRVPLNEGCWLNIGGIKQGGDAYINPIVEFVNRVTNRGWYVVVDLHWAAPGSQKPDKQLPMANADHSPTFWKDVASRFKSNSKVIFDLYNEPFSVSWACLRDGCTDPGYQTAGMQSLVDAVRSAGATNLVMVGGLQWSNDLSQWLTYMPRDSGNNIAASWHSYSFNACINQGCWDSTIAPIAQKYPVITGELGENDCNHGYIDSLLPYLDSKGVSYLAWTWNPYDCSQTPSLITGYDGTPSNFGVGYQKHLQSM